MTATPRAIRLARPNLALHAVEGHIAGGPALQGMTALASSLLAVSLSLAGCAIDVTDDDLTETDSELMYCGGELCDPRDPPAGPDLVAGPLSPTPCNFVYSTYPQPHYKLPIRITNRGTTAVGASKARVQFVISWTQFETVPFDVAVPALEPGTSYATYVPTNASCWLQAPGCDVRVTADSRRAYAELSETNNLATWHCAK